jgi:WD40 repeat protein
MLAALLWIVAAACGTTETRANELKPRTLFVMKADGSDVRHIVHVEGFRSLGAPRWSHDGRRLVFDARNPQPDANRCFVVGVEGQGLVDVGAGALCDWSPDDKQFAFAAGPNASLKKGIWVQNSDGRGRQWLSLGIAPHWSPDGSRIAFTLGALKILDLADSSTRTLPWPDRQPRRIQNGFAWSPDGTRIAAVFEDDGGTRQIVIVDATGGNEPARIRLAGPANDVAWSPDGKTLAASLRNAQRREHRIYLMSADGHDEPVEIPGQQGDTREPAWSPNGTLLAFASSRTDIPWAPPAGAARAARLELVHAYDKGGTVYSAGLTPDGMSAFIGGDLTQRGMQVWDTTTGTLQRLIDIPGIFLAVSPDGRHAAAAPYLEGNVQFVDLTDGSTLREFGHGATVIGLDFSGDGARLATAGIDNRVCIFDVASGDRLAEMGHAQEVKQVAFSPDGNLVASTSADNKLYMWHAANGALARQVDHPDCPWSVAFAPDGRHVATGTGGALIGKRTSLVVQPGSDNALRIWDVDDGKLVKELKGHTHVISSIDFSPDGKRAVTGSFDKSVRLWDIETGQELSRVDGQGWVTKVAFSSDGKLVLTTGGAEKTFQDRRWIEYPLERVRLFKVTPGEPSAKTPAAVGGK